MLNTTRSTGFAANPKKIEDEVGGNSMIGNSMVGGGKTTNPIKKKD